MTKARVPETNEGIQGVNLVDLYDQMQRGLRDKGWMETEDLIKSGIAAGHALEVGYGPGYLGLEWLKRCPQGRLTGLDISPDMQALAGRNASEYGFSDRTDYRLGQGDHLPFADGSFDAVFTNGSLHEWEHPLETFNEIGRVLKPGGRYFISDLRRDMKFLAYSFLQMGVKSPTMRHGLKTSVGAAYVPAELKQMLSGTTLAKAQIHASWIGMEVWGVK